jgi:dihydrofolate reductase
MQAPGGPLEDPTRGFTLGGWVVNYWDEQIGHFMGEIFANPFDLLLGRKTYEIFAAHWPFVEDPMAHTLNAATKYVVTSSTEPLTWTNSVGLGDNVAAEIARLKQEDGPNLLTQGSSVLLQTLLAHDLIDEFRLLVFPLVLGSGKRLFNTGTRPGALKHTATTVSTTGVVMSAYHRAGAISTGSFQLEHASQAEIARRERMQREG